MKSLRPRKTNSAYELTFSTWDPKSKISEQNRNGLIDHRDPTEGCRRRRGAGVQVKKVKGLRNAQRSFQSDHGDVKPALDNAADDPVRTVHRASGVPGPPWGLRHNS